MSCFTIYFDELYKIRLILKIVVENNFERIIRIFVDNQTTLKIINFFANFSKQYVFKNIVILFNNMIERKMKFHWISIHVNVSNNEYVDDFVKRVIEWVFANEISLKNVFCEIFQTTIDDVFIIDKWLNLTMKQRCIFKIKQI